MNTRRHRVKVIKGKVFIGTRHGENTVWMSLEGMLFVMNFFGVPKGVPTESFGYMLIDNGTVLRYKPTDPYVETIEAPY